MASLCGGVHIKPAEIEAKSPHFFDGIDLVLKCERGMAVRAAYANRKKRTIACTRINERNSVSCLEFQKSICRRTPDNFAYGFRARWKMTAKSHSLFPAKFRLFGPRWKQGAIPRYSVPLSRSLCTASEASRSFSRPLLLCFFPNPAELLSSWPGRFVPVDCQSPHKLFPILF